MNQLSNDFLKTRKSYPVRILQFGEGNFLRAFIDWMIHQMNKQIDLNAGVSVVQPIEKGLVHLLDEQDGLYTCYLNGIKNGKVVSEHEIIDCIQRTINPYSNYDSYLKEAENPELEFVFSNTTEAGISYSPGEKLGDRPQSSFPGKLTSLLYHRFIHFKGDPSSGLTIIPCELIENNGSELKEIILKIADEWELSMGFSKWINESITFCNTLVDRIVPGYPTERIQDIQKETGYVDKLVVEGEQFHLWVIEGPKNLQNQLPFLECGLNVIVTDDQQPYRTRKVRILNGAHTSMVPIGLLYGLQYVKETIENDQVGGFIKDLIFEEVIPTLDLPEKELHSFANEVFDRFRNPYLHHALMDISLNSISKFKTRVLPSLIQYVSLESDLPKRIVFALSALIAFYRRKINGHLFEIRDTDEIVGIFSEIWKNYDSNVIDLEYLVIRVLEKEEFWGRNLSEIPNLCDRVTTYLDEILKFGMNQALQHFD